MKSLPIIEKFLVGLSHVAPLDLEIRDHDGDLIMSSVLPDAKLPSEDPVHGFGGSLEESGTSPAADAPGHHGICGVPIENEGAIVGSLIAYGIDRGNTRFNRNSGDNPFRAGDIRKQFLKPMAGLIEDTLSIRQETEKMAEELTRSFEEIHLYSHIARQVKTLHFSGAMLTDLLDDLQMAMRTDLAFAQMPDRTEYNTVVTGKGCPRSSDPPDRFVRKLIRNIPPDTTFSDTGYFVVNHSQHSETFRRLHPYDYRFLAVPIKHNESSYGFLGMLSFNMEEIFRRGEMRMLISVAEQVGLVISNTDLFRNLENFLVNLVRSFIQAIEAKDTYTRGHSERVSRYCGMMAEELGMATEEKKLLEWASILHDVGKIGIPESILNKPGQLNDTEYDAIKKHPQKGYNILKPISQLSKALTGILHHHERYDGGGYPQGLAGEEISLAGRIIAIADTFDAISSNRAYRAEKTGEKALAIVKEVAGTQLDPKLVDVFETVYSKHIERNSWQPKQKSHRK